MTCPIATFDDQEAHHMNSVSRTYVPRFLVTAGNTREPIDRVRDWGNIFTGNTGFDIARSLARHGEVDLVTSNRTHLATVEAGLKLPHTIQGIAFSQHAELLGALAALMASSTYDAIFMTAAVADYRPAGAFSVLERRPGSSPGEELWLVRNVQAGKVKSNHAAIAILGEQTQKIVDLFRTNWQHKGLLFKFKLEVGIDRDELLSIGRASRKASGANYLVANTLDMVSGEKAGAYLLSDDGEEFVPRALLAEKLAMVAMQRMMLAR